MAFSRSLHIENAAVSLYGPKILKGEEDDRLKENKLASVRL